MLIALSFAAGVLIWTLASLIDYVAGSGRPFLDVLFLDISPQTLLLRLALSVPIPLVGLLAAPFVAKRRQTVGRRRQLERVRNSAHRVSRLLLTECDRDVMVRRICDALVDSGAYDDTMIVLTDSEGDLRDAVSGHRPEGGPSLDVCRPDAARSLCCRPDMWPSDGILAIDDERAQCGDCPGASGRPQWGFLTARMKHDDQTVGILRVALARRRVADVNEQSCLQEIASDVACGLHRIDRDAEREQTAGALRQQYEQLIRLNRIGQTLTSSLALDQVLHSTLEELRQLMNASACSVWLADPATDELVCRQTSGVSGEIMRGWRLGPGEGLASWVAHSGQSLIVPDAKFDQRHFEGVDRRTGLSMHSILSVPLRTTGSVIGVLQVLDTEVDRFGPSELALAEAFATTGAIAIDNARLYERANRLRRFNENIIQNMDEGIVIEDAKGCVTFVNRKTERLLNCRIRELKGRNALTLLAPDQVGLVTRETSSLPLGIASRYETVLLTREHQRVPVIISAQPLFSGEQFAGVLSVLTDISERKKIQEERVKLEKLESIGLLAGGIAHDFNNLLTTILGNISIAGRQISAGESALASLQAAERALLRARDLTRQLMTFSKGGAPVKSPTSLADLLHDTAGFALGGSLSHCDIRIPDDLWLADIDAGQISQVIQNLLINADQAMPDGGVIQIEADNVVVDSDSALPLSDGAYVRIAVRDHGVGIPERLLQRVFDPYFTTKEKGSGLGLATAYSIVRKHEGYIAVESLVGLGTTFSLYLPALATGLPPVSDDRTSSEETREAGARGRVLVMDQDELALGLDGEPLPLGGYDVDCVPSLSEALRVFRQARESGQPFDAVVIDLAAAGGVSGREVIEQLRRIDPDLNSIVSSAHTDDPILADFRQLGFDGVAVKPYRIEELEKTLRRILRARGDWPDQHHSADTGR